MHANQGSLFTGQPVLNQLLQRIPRNLVDRLTKKHKANHYCKKLFAFDHVVTMVACCFMRCTSLNELITGLQANAHRLAHVGLKNTPRKSTLADANARRAEAFFGELYHELHRIHYARSPDSRPKKGRMQERMYLLDSTTITLFSDVMHGTGRYALNGKKKGGAKAHVLTTHHGVPQEFVAVNDSFGESGTPEELLKKYGLDTPDVVAAARRAIKRK